MSIFANLNHTYRKKKRIKSHKALLAQFICNIHGQNQFSKPYQTVELTTEDLTDENVKYWSRVRHRIMHYARYDWAPGQRVHIPPLFLWHDEVEAMPEPTHQELQRAFMDLRCAVGMRCTYKENTNGE